MTTRIVFSGTGWVSVTLPVGHDPAWTSADKWTYAVAFIAAKKIFGSEFKATQIAEAIVSKRLYPGLEYGRELEEDLARMRF